MREGENGVCSGVEETTGNGATCTMSWQEWTALLQAYISWMNSQLRKKAGYRRVLDLRTDLQDGVALAQLVEILGGRKVPDLDEAPCTLLARKKNVERLILHLNNSKVTIPDASASGILEGDLRRVLQLIHAVAAHFKPSSVQKKINPNNVWNANQESNIKVQPEKPNGVFRAQQRLPVVVVNKVNNQSGKNENLARENGCVSERSTSTVIRVTSNVTPPKSRAVIPRVIGSRGGETTTSTLNERVTTSSEIDGRDPSAQVIRIGAKSQEGDMNCCRILQGGKNSKENGSTVSVKTSNSIRDWEEERKSIADDVVKARKQLLYLRDVLMRGSKGPHDRHPGRIRVDEKVKNISGSERMGIKSFKLDDNFHIADILEENERLRFENESLTKQVETKESQIAQLRDDIQLLEEKLEDYKGEDAAAKTNHKLRNGTSPQNEVDGAVDEEVSEEQKKDAALESQDVLLPLPYRSQHQDSQLLIVKDALSSLRKCFSSTDSNQHTLDTIEQSMATLLERVSIAEAIANNSFQMDMDGTSPKEWLYMETRQTRRAPTSPGSEPSVYGASSVGGHSRTYIERHTKVIYFFNKSTPPFITTVPKKIGEVTLRDFKIIFDRPGQFRFHFKTLDPDYGMVKEEVLHDDDILPGWDNKIIGWVEDDV